MTATGINVAVLCLNTVGLIIGVVGAILLAVFTKVFITVEPDGGQRIGPPPGASNEDWLANNRRLRKRQAYVIPTAYVCIMIGFAAQLVALWLPALCR